MPGLTPGLEAGAGRPGGAVAREGKMAMRCRRAFIIVLDGVGLGALPDAASYGDEGANTLAHALHAHGKAQLPALTGLGLGLVEGVAGLCATAHPRGAYGRSALVSPGKDTISGHWELTGVIVDRPFRTYPQGFPASLISAFTAAIGRPVLGNVPASGTEIIQRLGEAHLKTGWPIVYTSADSVFQVAAHEEVIPLSELYRICAVARELFTGEHQVGRVIARPFRGAPGQFWRTGGRRDFALYPPGPTLLDLAARTTRVTAVGKVHDIFCGRGITQWWPAEDNAAVMAALDALVEAAGPGLTLATLSDFDTKYGHRNDVAGWVRALEEFDAQLVGWLEALGPEDCAFFTADHGCDPTWPGTDHTREYVPLLVFGAMVRGGHRLGTRSTLADAGATVAEALGLPALQRGVSFWGEMACEPRTS